MENYRIVYNQNYLAHHGIQGQKWGVRNGPPYPLGAGDHSASEKKANWRQSLKDKGKTVIDNRKAAITKMVRNTKGAGVSETVIAYSAYAAMVLAIYGGALISAAVQKKRHMKQLENDYYADRHYKNLSDIPKETRKDTNSYLGEINPEYGADGTVQNCTFCTAALAMREKGYKVSAYKTDHGWYTKDLYNKCFTNAEQVKPKGKDSRALLSELEKQGDGAYGHLGVYWKVGGGHSIFYKNINGKVHIYDGQSGEEYDTRSTGSLFRAIDVKSTSYIRLDKSEPTDYVLGIVDESKPAKKKD